MSANACISCQYCNSACIKSGKRKDGAQKLKCKVCCKYQLASYTRRGWKKNTKENILKLYVKNVGIRDVAELLGISVNTVIKEIKKFKDYRRTISFKKNSEYEVDEMRTYIRNKKRRRWLVYALERISRDVVSIAVGRRTNATLKKVIDSVLALDPKRIYSDGYKGYQSLIPSSLHKVQKHKIQLIERKNLTARGKLRRLNKKTIAYSKSESMLLASAKLLFWKEINPVLHYD